MRVFSIIKKLEKIDKNLIYEFHINKHMLMTC